MQITIDAVDLPTRVRLPYAEHGDPDGIPLILLHGLSDSHRSYEPILAELPQGIRAFALTQRGHGDASRPGSYHLDDLAADVACFIDAMGLESAVVAGHSMGSVVAQRVALEYPHYVDALVVMGGASTWRNVDLAELDAQIDIDPTDAAFIREFQLSTLSAPVPEDYLDMVCAESAKLDRTTWRRAFDGTITRDFSDQLPNIAVPTLLGWGEHDFVPRAEQDAMLEAISDSRLVVYEGAGHAFHWERPAEFARDLSAFIAQID
jgi:non-heme chloroperoxidase